MTQVSYGIGLDAGSASIKIILIEDSGRIIYSKTLRHYGAVRQSAETLLAELLAAHPECAFSPIMVTGCMHAPLSAGTPKLAVLDEIPALSQGIALVAPQARSLIEVGSQNARYMTDLGQERPPRFATNEHCAGGTGSFFEDQMSRLGLALEDYSRLALQADNAPRMSGRCAVFAKTDIIHLQQEGTPIPDILLGLCYAMVRNFKAVIVRSLPIEKPLALAGGIALNAGVVKAVKDVFQLDEDTLIVPPLAEFVACIGAAKSALASESLSLETFLEALKTESADEVLPRLAPLSLSPTHILKNPEVSGTIPPEGCALGIDIGSTSTDLVLIAPDGSLIDMLYLRTAGDPEKAVRQGLQALETRYGRLQFLAVGVTGSGRERIGRLTFADVVRDEITAQACAASWWSPEADTVFEIGGQDSKYISLENGQVRDFRMNKICAAGTGSFIEEQAARMNIPLSDFGPLALSAKEPVALGERCTVFIETAIQSAASRGASHADIAAGLCHAIVRNYLHKVVGEKPIGNHVVLQGGVAYNPGIVAAFQHVLGDKLVVSPCFSATGAFGAAMLALKTVDGPSTFHGFSENAAKEENLSLEVRKNIAFYNTTDKLLLQGYDPTPKTGRKTVGIPFALLIHKFFPMAHTFFKNLGFNVLLSPKTNEDIIRLAQENAQAETCYPVKLLHGHMAWLANEGVDYIFMPSIHTMRHETSQVEHNYGCVYMQTAPGLVARSLRLKERGITLLNPMFDLDFGKEAMAAAMLELGKVLGIPKPRLLPALMAGAMAVRKHSAAAEKQGQALLASLQPEEKVLVLITRNYGLSDPVLNMGIPKLLLERGHKVITLSHLPAHDLDLSQDYPNLYWPFGQHILSGAKLVAHHPNLYAVLLTNHGCGPDTMLQTLFRREMGDKPYLQIEVDEHFSSVGVITRIEAFLESLKTQPVKPLTPDFSLKAVQTRPYKVLSLPSPAAGPLYLPEIPPFSPYLRQYFAEAFSVETHTLPFGDDTLSLGRAETTSKEYLPYPALLGAVIALANTHSTPLQVLIPTTEGAEADGQYAWAILAVLERLELNHVTIVSPVLEKFPEHLPEPDTFFRALTLGDLLLSAPKENRHALTPSHIPSWLELERLAQHISTTAPSPQKLGLVGEPLTLFALGGHIRAHLEAENWALLTAPLSEALYMLWKEAGTHCPETWGPALTRLAQTLGEHSNFSSDLTLLSASADKYLPRFAGACGRYRLAKILELAQKCAGTLSIAPRYENTATIIEMTGALENIPHLHLALDNDWDAGASSRLRSFLYYLK